MPKTMKEAEWEEMDETVASAIRLNLSDEVLNNINVEDCTTAGEIWKRLEELYMAKNLSNKLYLKKELYSMRMSENILLSLFIKNKKKMYKSIIVLKNFKHI